MKRTSEKESKKRDVAEWRKPTLIKLELGPKSLEVFGVACCTPCASSSPAMTCQ